MIYMDVLIALNWFLDYALLSGTVRLLHIPYRRIRLVLGSLTGALLAALLVLLVLPGWLSAFLRLAAALPVVLIAFGWGGWRQNIVRLVVFFALSTALAGLVLLLYTLAAPQGLRVINGVVYYNVSPFWLAVLTAAGYGVLCLYERWGRLRQLEREYRLELTGACGTRVLRALYDSGNRLIEGFSGKPVIVADKAAIIPLLTTEQQQFLEWKDAPTDLPGHWRLIPYRTIGGDGLLPAFVPERAALCAGKKRRDITGVYIAITDRLGRGEYEALVGATVARTLTERGEDMR